MGNKPPQRQGLRTTFLVAIIIVSVLGFLAGIRGTGDPSPWTARDLISRSGDPPEARNYAELRGHNDKPTGDVARACTDCHDDRLTPPAAAGQRHEHPIGISPPAGADIQALMDAGGRVAVQDDGALELECRSCHRPHSADEDARLVISADDGTLCLSCHTDKHPGQSLHPVTGLGSDGVSCLACHDPHESASAPLLRAAGGPEGTCLSCHTDKSGAAAGAHGGETCTSCHGLHDPAALPHGATSEGVGPQLCLDCHTTDHTDSPLDLALSHPLGVEAPEHGALPMPGGALGCTSCHDPHSAAPHRLRADTAVLCTTCHADKTSVLGTDHDAALGELPDDDDTCLSCHQVHGSDAAHLVPTRGLDENPAIGRCLRCHDGSTTATSIERWTHPTGLLLTADGLPFRYKGEIPYYDPSGERTADRQVGEITCSTCHDPHRWKHDSDSVAGAVDGSEQDSFLRDPDEIAQFCTVCHGVDGRPRFRFFHAETFREEPAADEPTTE